MAHKHGGKGAYPAKKGHPGRSAQGKFIGKGKKG